MAIVHSGAPNSEDETVLVNGRTADCSLHAHLAARCIISDTLMNDAYQLNYDDSVVVRMNSDMSSNPIMAQWSSSMIRASGGNPPRNLWPRSGLILPGPFYRLLLGEMPVPMNFLGGKIRFKYPRCFEPRNGYRAVYAWAAAGLSCPSHSIRDEDGARPQQTAFGFCINVSMSDGTSDCPWNWWVRPRGTPWGWYAMRGVCVVGAQPAFPFEPWHRYLQNISHEVHVHPDQLKYMG
ncbi:hypothetical protein EDD15DRAFT_2197203 [Pisolithus albus]|nr:hypothetical protein EDD15DRAFT_2197203 [Pisolithus albus]